MNTANAVHGAGLTHTDRPHTHTHTHIHTHTHTHTHTLDRDLAQCLLPTHSLTISLTNCDTERKTTV